MNATPYRIEDAMRYVEAHAARLRQEYKASCFPDIPKAWEGFCAGSFLGDMLQERDCPEEERHRICFALGQRSAFGNPWEWALKYLNEFCCFGQVRDQPGEELAAEISREHFGDLFGEEPQP